MSEGYRPEPLENTARPFARLVELPDDLAEAVESFKLSILRHKLAGWTAVSRSDVTETLKSLIDMTKDKSP